MKTPNPTKPVALRYQNSNGTKTLQLVKKFEDLREELEDRRLAGEQTFAFERELHRQHKADLDTIMAGGTVPNCKAIYA